MAFSEYDSSCGCDCCANVNKLRSYICYSMRRNFKETQTLNTDALYIEAFWKCVLNPFIALLINIFGRNWFILYIDIDIVRLLSNWQRLRFYLAFWNLAHTINRRQVYGPKRYIQHMYRWITYFIYEKIIFVDWNTNKFQTNTWVPFLCLLILHEIMM